MKKAGLDIVIDVEEHLRNLKQKVQIITQACSMIGGKQKYLSELNKCFQQHIQEFSEEIYTNLLEQKSNAKKVKESILDAGQHFLPIYGQLMSKYNFGSVITSYDKTDDDIQLYQSKLEQFLTKESDKFSKKYISHNKPFWKKWEFWSIAIPSIIGLLAFL